MLDKKVISTEDGRRLADEYNLPFMETSAKGNIMVEDAFTTLARYSDPSCDHLSNLYLLGVSKND